MLLQQNSNLLLAVFLTIAVSVAFHHCTTPPLVLLHVVACLAQPLSENTFTNFEGVIISIRLFALGALFKFLTIRFRFISSLAVGHVIFLALSFTLYMASTLSWHMYNFSTTVLYIVRLSLSSLMSDSVVGVLFTWSHHGFCFFPNQEHLSRFGCSSDSLPSSILVPFAQSLSPGKIVTCFLHSSCVFIKTCFERSSTSFITFFGPNINPSST